MKQACIKFMLTTLMTVVWANVWAQNYDFESEGLYYKYWDGGVTVVNPNDDLGTDWVSSPYNYSSITIPNEVKDGDGSYIKVTKIGHAAFCGCQNLTTISISDNVKEIDGFAFSGCI